MKIQNGKLMCLRITMTLLVGTGSIAFADGADAVTPGASLIAEFGLRESAAPVSERAGWRAPKRIVVDAGVPGLIEGLKRAAPGIVLVPTRTAAEMATLVANADAAIGRTILICNDAVLAAGKNLRWLQTTYAGVEVCTSKSALGERHILLTNMRAVAGPVIAEHAMAMLLALTRGLHVSIPRQSSGTWDGDYPGAEIVSLHGKTMLIVGLGGIGSEVAKRAAAFDMRVVATRATTQERPVNVQYVGTPEELPTLLKDADVVVDALPLTSLTKGLFDAKMFALMKPTAIFVNVARGGSVVTNDLTAALTAHRIAGAALDVTDPEPLPQDHPLWHAPNVIITPHIAAAPGQIEVVLRVLRENLRRYAAGERMLSEVDLQRGY